MNKAPTAREIRAGARQALKGHWRQALTVTLAYIMMRWFMTRAMEWLGVAPAYSYARMIENITGIMRGHAGMAALTGDAGRCALSLALQAVICVPLYIGWIRFLLALYDRGEARVSTLFSPFADGFVQSIWLELLKNARIWLVLLPCMLPFLILIMVTGGTDAMHIIPAWLFCVMELAALLLIIIPVSACALRLSLSAWVLADRPDAPAALCISESRKRMPGNRWRLIRLTLSLTGWALLPAVPAYLVSRIASAEIAEAAVVFFMTPVMAYATMSTAVFFRNLAPQTAPDARFEHIS